MVVGLHAQLCELVVDWVAGVRTDMKIREGAVDWSGFARVHLALLSLLLLDSSSSASLLGFHEIRLPLDFIEA